MVMGTVHCCFVAPGDNDGEIHVVACKDKSATQEILWQIDQ